MFIVTYYPIVKAKLTRSCVIIELNIPSKLGEIQLLGISWAADPCRSGTIWIRYWTVLSCEIKCQKFGESLCDEIIWIKSR